MASDITYEITDNRTGAQYGKGYDGIGAKIGRGYNSAAGEAKIPYKITSPQSAAYFFGENSPLHKSAKLHFNLQGKYFYAAMPSNDVDGSVGAITSSNVNTSGVKEGTGDLTVDSAGSTPQEDNTYTLLIMKAGGDNVAQFKYKKNDSAEWSQVYTFSGDSIALEGGVILDVTFDPTTPENSFKAGDQYRFSTTAPGFSAIELENCLDAFNEQKYFRFIQILPQVDIAFAQVFAAWLKEMKLKKKWLIGLIQLRDMQLDEDEVSYPARLKTEAESFYDQDIAVFYLYYTSKNLSEEMTEADKAFVILSRAKVHQSIGETGAFPLEDVVDIKNWDILKHHYEALEEKGLNAMYYEDGESSGTYPFFKIGQLKANTGSDFRKISSGRTLNKSLYKVNEKIFPLLRSSQGGRAKSVTGGKAGLQFFKGQIELALDAMVNDGEIQDYVVNIDALDDPNKSIEDVISLIVNGEVESLYEITPYGHFEKIKVGASLGVSSLLAGTGGE